MNFTPQQIKTITQSVLQELASRGVTGAAGRSTKPSLTAVTAVNGKVITEESLIAASAAGQKIAVPAGAIITPSGHDYMRRNGVTISTDTAVANATVTTGVVIVIGDCSSAASAAATARWNVMTAGCEFDAARKSKQHVSKPVVCVGGEPSVTACLLNRDAALRTAVVNQKTDIQSLINAMRPQVVCVDSSGWSFAELLRLLRSLASESTATPDKWKELAQ